MPPGSASGSRRAAMITPSPEQIVALGNHLALMHADAQPQAVGLGVQPLLDGDSAA